MIVTSQPWLYTRIFLPNLLILVTYLIGNPPYFISVFALSYVLHFGTGFIQIHSHLAKLYAFKRNTTSIILRYVTLLEFPRASFILTSWTARQPLRQTIIDCSPPTEEEVMMAVSHLKNGKAQGCVICRLKYSRTQDWTESSGLHPSSKSLGLSLKTGAKV